MAWTAPITWVFKQVWSASLFNQQVRDNLNYLKDKPLALVDFSAAADQTLPLAGVWTKMTGSELALNLDSISTVEFVWNIGFYGTAAARILSIDVYDVDTGTFLSSGTASPRLCGLGATSNLSANIECTNNGRHIRQAVSAGLHNYELWFTGNATDVVVRHTTTRNIWAASEHQ
jgi:hypothetical protein